MKQRLVRTLTQSEWHFNSSQEWARILTLRFLKYGSWTAIRPNSVVQTGVKSAGWENNTTHLKIRSKYFIIIMEIGEKGQLKRPNKL